MVCCHRRVPGRTAGRELEVLASAAGAAVLKGVVELEPAFALSCMSKLSQPMSLRSGSLLALPVAADGAGMPLVVCGVLLKEDEWLSLLLPVGLSPAPLKLLLRSLNELPSWVLIGRRCADGVCPKGEGVVR